MIDIPDPDNQVYLNGAYTRLADAKVSVLDRGFIFGDGIYEVVPVYQGRAFRMAEHLARLSRSLAAVRIAAPLTVAQWEALVAELVARSSTRTCLIYIQVTRGVARRDHAFPAQAPAPTVFAMATSFTPPDARQREQGLSAISIEDERWLHCDIKSVSLLGNVLAKQQAVDAGVFEAIQFRGDQLTEGSSTNVWLVKDGVLIAPPRSNLILEGVRYSFMLTLAQELGIEVDVRVVSRQQVAQADELMITSASKEIVPIVRLDDRPLGTGKPGPVYAALRAGYDARIKALQ